MISTVPLRDDRVGVPGGCKSGRLDAPSATLPVLRVGLPPRDLLQHVANKQRVVDQVAVSEPARLSHQPEQPFQPRALDPDRGTRLRAGMEVKRSADAD